MIVHLLGKVLLLFAAINVGKRRGEDHRVGANRDRRPPHALGIAKCRSRPCRCSGAACREPAKTSKESAASRAIVAADEARRRRSPRALVVSVMLSRTIVAKTFGPRVARRQLGCLRLSHGGPVLLSNRRSPPQSQRMIGLNQVDAPLDRLPIFIDGGVSLGVGKDLDAQLVAMGDVFARQQFPRRIDGVGLEAVWPGYRRGSRPQQAPACGWPG